MKLGETAAKRVNGSVKCAKPAQHGCRRARGDELGGRSGNGAAGGTGQSPGQRGWQGQTWPKANGLSRIQE